MTDCQQSRPDGLTKLKVLSLFAGVGGFDLGLERTNGFETVAFCEINPFCRRILAKHWPEVTCYEDVRELTSERLAADGIAVDVIVGGFPCQDISLAGKQAGIVDGTRSGLWGEVVRLVRDLRPRFLIVENVSNLLAGPSDRRGGWFGRVLGDLAECGYDAEWENIPAAALGASHRRERVWLVAHDSSDRLQGLTNAGFLSGRWPVSHEQLEGLLEKQRGVAVPSGRGGGVHDGVPDRVDRIHALGNAVVPQIPELIGRAILASLEQDRMAA